MFSRRQRGKVTDLGSCLHVTSCTATRRYLTRVVRLCTLRTCTPRRRHVLTNVHCRVIDTNFNTAAPCAFTNSISGRSICHVRRGDSVCPKISIRAIPIHRCITKAATYRVVNAMNPVCTNRCSRLGCGKCSCGSALNGDNVRTTTRDCLHNATNGQILAGGSHNIIRSRIRRMSPGPNRAIVLSLSSGIRTTTRATLARGVTSLHTGTAGKGNNSTIDNSIIVLSIGGNNIVAYTS